MKVAIAYYSKHHGNTKKLLDAIAAKNEVTLIDVTETKTADLSGYERIGFASGIYYQSFAKQLIEFAKENLPNGKDVFFISTYGAENKKYFNSIRKVTDSKNCKELGRYGCLGFDTYGPFKIVGGVAKGHPTQEEIDGAVKFYSEL